MSKDKPTSLTEIVAKTVLTGAVLYPGYATILYAFDKEAESWVDKLSDTGTLALTAGAMLGVVVFELGKKIYQHYKK